MEQNVEVEGEKGIMAGNLQVANALVQVWDVKDETCTAQRKWEKSNLWDKEAEEKEHIDHLDIK